ncbi:MAG: hypothetical protein IPG45_12760 [Deltaproteobacteria bacterium]|jgi:hypothetical protein|nr:hypothetical protein [Deltaproteobacteria bacterium]
MTTTVTTGLPSANRTASSTSLTIRAAVAGLTIVAVGACLAAALRSVDDHLSASDDRALASAERNLMVLVERDSRALVSQVRVLSDDARIREPLATPGIDNATIEDLLGDLRSSGGYELMAVLDRAGTVRAIAGNQGLKGADLGTTEAVKKANEQGAAGDVWSFSDRLMMIAVTPIRLGADVVAYLLIGNGLDQAALTQVAQRSHLVAGLVLNDQVAGSSADDPGAQAALQEAAKLSGEQSQAVAGGKYLAKISRVDRTRGGRIAWLVERHHERGEISSLTTLLWAAFGILVVGVSAVAFIGTRPS